MKKIRYIPYGYSVRNGHTVIEHNEAEVIRMIFTNYINGASLQNIADLLTEEKIPYTEKTARWDRARIARILENSRYAGTPEYDPIIDTATYEAATTAKTARQHSKNCADSRAIALLRNRMRCAECGSPMIHHIASNRKTKDSWTCSNDSCGIRVRIGDNELLTKITIVMNRIIRNTELLIPKPKVKHVDSPKVSLIQKAVEQEMLRENPSEELIVSLIGDMASQIYSESTLTEMIASKMLWKSVQSMRPSDTFDCRAFSALVETVSLHQDGMVTLNTKTGVPISEGEGTGGGPKDTEKDGNRN